MIAALSFFFCPPARATEKTVLIRDTEIEDTLKEWLAPLAAAAEMDPKSIRLIIVQSPQINAFVAGGSNIFIYTGLIEKTENPGELIGVMAHELGHIAGGHLIAGRGAAERASYESILGMALGIGTAVLGGGGQAASAVILGSQSLAATKYLSHSRVQESSADQAALRFMNASNINPSGLISFFEKLESEELLPARDQSAYMRTHPLTRDRIEAARVKVQQSPAAAKPMPAQWIEQHARMKAKLTAFINPGAVPWQYDDRDTSVAARYARAIAAYRENRVYESLRLIDALIASEPANPYFQELKGQMLVDFGRVAQAIPYYRAASKALPDSGLIRIALGQALMESGNPAQMSEVIDQLERALQDEPRSSRAHRLLATAYGRTGREVRARLHLAEEALLIRRMDDAKMHAQAVIDQSPKNSRDATRAQDILEQVRIAKDKNEEE